MVRASETGPGRVVIVGGGVIGVTLAWRLGQAGAAVTVMEANTLGSGASSASLAWINANTKVPESYHRLNVAGIGEHLALARELEGGEWLNLAGHARVPLDANEASRLVDHVERLRRWGYAAELLTTAEFQRLEPEVADAGTGLVGYFSLEGIVDVSRFLRSLRRAANALGVSFREGALVDRVEVAGGRVRAVHATAGERLDADVLVLCTGARTSALASMLDFTVPMTNTVGLVASVLSPRTRLNTLLTSRHANVRPDGADRYSLQCPALDHRLADADPSDIAQEVVERAQLLVPSLANAQLVDARTAARPIPADGLPLVGPVPGLDNAYLAVAHSGVTLAPTIARLLAREIAFDVVDERLVPFRPERLASPA